MRLSFELIGQSDGTGLGWTEKSNNENPYSVQQLALVSADTKAASIKKITSIPSPYARLHLTQIAFEEGTRTPFESLPPVYQRAISHCLDVFELFYRFDGNDLQSHGIEIKKNKYVKKDFSDKKELTNQDIYIKALQLYRHNYGEENFTNFFTINKYVEGENGENRKNFLMAVTSPFTMFSTPEDLDNENCQIKLQDDSGVILFENNDDVNKNHWRGIESRSPEIQKFIFSLITKYNSNYKSLYTYLEKRLDKAELGANPLRYFDENYQQFQVAGTVGVPLNVEAKTSGNVEILPRNYDKFMFEKNFVNLPESIDLSQSNDKIFNEQMQLPFDQRINIFSGTDNPERLNWITIDDLLEDVVFVSDHQIDTSRYLGVSSAPNVFLPLKKLYFQLFNFYDVNGKLLDTEAIEQKFQVKYEKLGDSSSTERVVTVTLCLPKIHEGVVKLTKIYHEKNIRDINIDFGIYPFVRMDKSLRSGSDVPENFYRMMLYLKSPLKNLHDDIKVYAKNSEGLLEDKRVDKNEEDCFHVQRQSTITNRRYQTLNDNLYYLSMESVYLRPGIARELSKCKDVRFDFVELNLEGSKLLIVPRLKVYMNNTHTNNVAVDLGTSNTYVAYGNVYEGSGTNDFNQFEDIDGEAIVGKLCMTKSTDNIFDFTQNGYHQWCEFIPTEFGPKGAHFPIQTIQFRNLSVEGNATLESELGPKDKPLVSMYSLNVPFRMEDTGSRKIENALVDERISNFKWFKVTECLKKNSFKLFVDQICFMLRSKLICNEFDITNIKLAWTYPLALSQLNLFKEIWENTYLKYFNEPTPQNVLSFTESETPMNCSECAKESGDKVGIDIGGGTADIILYKGKNNGDCVINEISLATSFSFAGNAMFGHIIGNNAEMKNKENIWYSVLKELAESYAKKYNDSSDNKKQSEGMKRQIFDISDDGRNISDFMSYIFAHPMRKNPVEVQTLLQASPLMFISLFHISALIWEVAKVCKKRLGAERVPKYVVFSGNGSKLILMSLPDVLHDGTKRDVHIQDLVRIIFRKVYNKDRQPNDCVQGCDKITVEMLKEPKQATSNGALALMAARETMTKTSGKYFIPFNGNLYHKADGMGIPMAESIDNMNSTSTLTQSAENPLFGGNLFGGSGITGLGCINPNQEQKVEVKENDFIEEVKENRPFVSEIMNHEDKIIEDFSEFVEFFLNNLAVLPIGGNLTKSAISIVKKEIFGSAETYHTPQMKEMLENAIENTIKNNADGDRLNESVFLVLCAYTIAEFIKFFTENNSK